MAYVRRYMRPFVGTTIVIQDEAITQDKLADKSVEEVNLADSAVSERAIGTGAVDTDELKNGAVKTVDIGDAQVTEPKLADGAVTENKLSFTPSTRPLAPGVGSAEILDDAVIESKYGDDSIPAAAYKPGSVDVAALAGDAVETVKVKDRNITSSKVALDSLGTEHLKANSVSGTEILDGAVSVGKLGTNAVETVKIKALNVTKPKLEFDLLHLLLQDRQLFCDDFLGATLRSEWAQSGDPGGSALQNNSRVRIQASGVDDELYRINFGNIYPTSQGDNPKVFARLFSQITFVHVRFGLYFNATNYMLFDLDTDVDFNWHLKINEAGVETDNDSGVLATTAMKTFKIDHTQTNEVKFYIDGSIHGILINNVPLVNLQPWLEIQNRSGSARTLTVDKYILSADNSVGPPPP